MFRLQPFIHDDFILGNEPARRLYHDVAADLPLVDYHGHLDPDQIADDASFRNLTHIWLDGDHYKWRAMRACGVEERLITGDADDRDKFMAWAKTVPHTLRNPLYHWTHMELGSIFGIRDRLLNEQTAASIWDECNERLQEPGFTTQGLIRRHRVEVVATTDDPAAGLDAHARFQAGPASKEFKLVPTFRPDRGMEIGNSDTFRQWVLDMARQTDVDINSFKDLMASMAVRFDQFHALGCRATDHGLEEPYDDAFSEPQIEAAFSAAMAGHALTIDKIRAFKSAFLHYCGVLAHERGWVMQLHIGALRNTNTRMMSLVGRDGGFDSIGDASVARPLARMLDRLDAQNTLPRIILYNLNPRDNEVFSTMIGNFQDGGIPGKLQHGPSWWFLDQKDGIEKHLDSLSNSGILSHFVGMTTDSRSFLSWPRHDYFRRIVCNRIGQDIEQGLLPDEPELIDPLITRICHTNARDFFRFG